MLSRRATPAGAASVLVLRIDDNPFHHGTLGAIRTLGRLGVPVFMTQRGGDIPASASRFLRGTVRWPVRDSDTAGLAAELLGLALPVDGDVMLLPVDDAGAILLAEQANHLRSRFLLPRQSAATPSMLADKQQLATICERLEIPHPLCYRPPTWDALLRYTAQQTSWPVVAKRIRPWSPPSAPGLKSTTLVRSAADFRSMAEQSPAEDPGLLLQEFIPAGGGPQDWIVNAYYGAGSRRVVAWSGFKLRSYPPYSGLMTLGAVRDNPALLDLADRAAAGTGFTGICDMDFRYDERDHTNKLLDFNPRLGAQFRLFTDRAGTDVVRAWYGDTLGAAVTSGPAPSRRALLVENYDPIASFTYWRDSRLGIGEWLRSLLDVRELGWFALDDPLPFAAMARRSLHRAVERRRHSGDAAAVIDREAVPHQLVG
jgi:D-aspartate ligase